MIKINANKKMKIVGKFCKKSPSEDKTSNK